MCPDTGPMEIRNQGWHDGAGVYSGTATNFKKGKRRNGNEKIEQRREKRERERESREK